MCTLFRQWESDFVFGHRHVLRYRHSSRDPYNLRNGLSARPLEIEMPRERATLPARYARTLASLALAR